jgi:photosystem II stability/assembly factor-like uncharacterized protein
VVYAAGPQKIFKSSDSGQTWTALAAPLAKIPSAIAIHPSRPEIIYAGVSGSGVFKSMDGGQNWTPINTGFGNLNVVSLLIDRANPDTLFAGIATGLYRSTDAGQTWTKVSAIFQARALAPDPGRPGTIYAGGRGIVKSTDGGLTWTAADSGIASPAIVQSLAIDPAHSDIVYAGTENSGMYKTIDGGMHWQLIGAESQRTR